MSARGAFLVPDLVRQRALANGRAGTRWLTDLPDVVDALLTAWDLRLDFAMKGGTAALVLAVTDPTGRQCVLKVPMRLDMDDDDSSFARAVLSHELAAGRGCAAIHRHRTDPPAMLLERLGADLAELALPLPELFEAVASTLRTFWRPVATATGLRTGAAQAEWLAQFIVSTWEELGRPCDPGVIHRAVALCEVRCAAYDRSSSVLVHGDAHGWNTLDAGNAAYKFVDPEGLLSEPAHDLSVLMREYNGPLVAGDTARLVRERAELLAGWCNVDPEAVWQWGFIERVSTGLANVRDFDNDDGRIFLEVARRCL